MAGNWQGDQKGGNSGANQGQSTVNNMWETRQEGRFDHYAVKGIVMAARWPELPMVPETDCA